MRDKDNGKQKWRPRYKRVSLPRELLWNDYLSPIAEKVLFWGINAPDKYLTDSQAILKTRWKNYPKNSIKRAFDELESNGLLSRHRLPPDYRHWRYEFKPYSYIESYYNEKRQYLQSDEPTDPPQRN